MLLEVVLATALMAIGLFAIIDGLSRCLAAMRKIQSYTTADTLLANKSYEFHVERPGDYLDQQGAFDDYPGFTWTREFESTDTESLWEQTITVYWYEHGKLTSDSVVEYRYLPEKQR
jgi:hypothetical protein